MQISVAKWRPGILSSMDLGLQTKIKVAKHQLMSEFKCLVEKLLDLQDAVIMRRTPLNQLQAVEVLS